MSKSKINPRTLTQAQKIAGYHCKEVEEMAKDVGARIVADQAEWLDAQMQDLLPPPLFSLGRTGTDPEGKLAEYINKHGIKIEFIPDALKIRIWLRGKVHSQFTPRLLLDGEPIEFRPEGLASDQN